MIRKYKLMILGVFISFIANQAMSQELKIIKEYPFKFNASYIGDVVCNFDGGIKSGTTYLGLANIKVDFNTGIVNWWKGGEVFINAGNTHGGEPSNDLIGDFQGVSNIEAGDHSFLYELWYKQSIGKVDVTFGQQDLNASFATCENGALFTNSSFGIHSSISDNVSPPIFPLTALGANIQWNISDRYLWEAAIFDGTPGDFENNPYNAKWEWNKDKGFLAITEFQIHKSLLKGKAATYKIGVYFHEHNDTLNIQKKDGGFYFVGDQQISTKLSVFSQIGLSPRKLNKNNRYFSAGLSYKGIISKRQDDQLGLAVAYAGIDGNSVGSEIAVELTYKVHVNKNIYLRPDIQYILNPAGTDVKLKNAMVGFIRFGIDF